MMFVADSCHTSRPRPGQNPLRTTFARSHVRTFAQRCAYLRALKLMSGGPPVRSGPPPRRSQCFLRLRRPSPTRAAPKQVKTAKDAGSGTDAVDAANIAVGDAAEIEPANDGP